MDLESPVIVEALGIVMGAPVDSTLPKFLRIRCRTTGSPLGQFDLRISEAAVAGLVEVLGKRKLAPAGR